MTKNFYNITTFNGPETADYNNKLLDLNNLWMLDLRLKVSFARASNPLYSRYFYKQQG